MTFRNAATVAARRKRALGLRAIEGAELVRDRARDAAAYDARVANRPALTRTRPKLEDVHVTDGERQLRAEVRAGHYVPAPKSLGWGVPFFREGGCNE